MRRFWFGIGIAAIFLIMIVWRLDLDGLADSFSNAKYIYLIPAIGIYFIGLVFRASRWSLLLSPITTLRWWRLYAVVVVGYTANNLLPIRLGELARSYYLAKRESISPVTSLATILIERVYDGLTLLLFLALAGLFLPIVDLTQQIGNTLRIPGVVVILSTVLPFLIALMGIVFVGFKPSVFQRLIAIILRLLPSRVRGIIDGVLQRFLDGFQGMHQMPRLMSLFFWSIPIWLAEVAVYCGVGFAFGIEAHFHNLGTFVGVMFVVTAVSNLAGAIPLSQGSIGTFEFMVILTLEFLSVSNGLASAYAVVLHLVLLLPVMIAGIAHLTLSDVTLGELLARNRLAK